MRRCVLFFVVSIFINSSRSAIAVDLLDIEQFLIDSEPENITVQNKIDLDKLLLRLTYDPVQKVSDISESTILPTSSANDSSLVLTDQVEMIILNKITAQSTRNVLTVGQKRCFNNLSIIVDQCVKNIDLFKGENFVLLTVWDNVDNKNMPVFRGWMVSSNPSISTLEHPVYEIIIVDCINKQDK